MPLEDPAGDEPLDPEATTELLARAARGDGSAQERLLARCLPYLRRWARGRLPRQARDLLDTDDLVQDTVLKTLRHLDSFKPRHEGALQAYLRQAIVNRIRDEVRRIGRRPLNVALATDHPGDEQSPLEEAIGREALARYENALGRLRPEEREAIVMRIELQQTYQQMAIVLGKPSADAARMAVSRALVRLAEEMDRAG